MKQLQKSIAKYGIYIEELRRRLFFLTKLFVIFFAAGFLGTTPAIRVLMRYIQIDGVTIVTTSPFQLIELAMSVGFFGACIITVPLLVYHLYSFLRPGLHAKERRSFLVSLPLGLLLFCVGFAYGCAVLYYGVTLIADVNISLGVANYWDITSFISNIVFTSSLLGLLFLFPILITFLIRLGIMSKSFLRSKRRHAIVVIFIFVSLLPPTDGISLLLMAVPLIVIFEITILCNRTKRQDLVY